MGARVQRGRARQREHRPNRPRVESRAGQADAHLLGTHKHRCELPSSPLAVLPRLTSADDDVFLFSALQRCLQIVEPVRQPNGEFLPPYPLIVTGSRDSTIRVWRLPSKGEPEYRSTSPDVDPDEPVPPEENPFHNHCLEGHQNAVRAIAAHGRYCVSGSYDCTVRVWDIVKGTCLHVLRGHQQKGAFFVRVASVCAVGDGD